MLVHETVDLEKEAGGIATVRCRRCHEAIGRIQVSPSPADDPRDWEEKVQGELDVITREHEFACPMQPPGSV